MSYALESEKMPVAKIMMMMMMLMYNEEQEVTHFKGRLQTKFVLFVNKHLEMIKPDLSFD